ncbi:biotin--[acetyl-CoA-carboxylase] ligase [Limosilactobacillus caecicola]|uniref:biotin--[acetyl-CoA-carboxylase] ligase n=1 Tax=Limosilactobacillus caecicola TaxID=2941332 RepID=UPI0020412BEB|nr:biotin--[acetyl-CoA-carboxylase] ligase [Limosilactobacillus caecicola]
MKLDQGQIAQYLGDHFPGKVLVAQSVPSTQQWAKQSDDSVPAAFLAEQQTAGYGKRARKFFSPEYTGLYLSISLPNIPVAEMPKAGLFTTGLANTIANVLENYYPGKHLGVKWVNDVYLSHKKVCGILVEAQMTGTKLSWIVGIGINLSTVDFPDEIANQVASIGHTPIDRNCLAADIIQNVWRLKQDYQSGKFIDEYKQRLIIRDHEVTLQLADRAVTGQVRGIDEQGRLVLETTDHYYQAFSDGEVIKVQY